MADPPFRNALGYVIEPGQYLVLKTHPALEDTIGECTLFRELFALLNAVKGRDRQLYTNIIAAMEPYINSPRWVFDTVQNMFLHQVLRVGRGTGSLYDIIVSFLSRDLNCGRGDGEKCLRTRRNSQNHLVEDYCGVAPGTTEALRAALLAAVKRKPSLAGEFVDLASICVAPFDQEEARGIATAIVKAVEKHNNSSQHATAAATAAALHLCKKPRIFHDYSIYCSSPLSDTHTAFQNIFTKQQATAAAAAKKAADQLVLQEAPHPLIAGNLFHVNDIANILSLIEPRVLCILHEAMFVAGELQSLEFHYSSREVNLQD